MHQQTNPLIEAKLTVFLCLRNVIKSILEKETYEDIRMLDRGGGWPEERTDRRIKMIT